MIAVLLSTYNGAQYLCEQLDSIINQTYQDFVIYIRDDGSSDNTVFIIKDYAKKYSHKIVHIEDNFGNLGVRESFEQLMKKANANYYCFCDQDDYWFPEKLSILTEETKKHPNDIPVLFFSDMELVNAQNKTTNKSYIKKVKYSEKTLEQAFIAGGVPGCSMMFNESLKNIYFQNKLDVLLHDHNIYILAKIFGKIIFNKTQTVKYRIHTNNTIGIGKKYPPLLSIKDLLKFIPQRKQYRNIIFKEYYNKLNVLEKKEIHSCFNTHQILINQNKVEAMSFFERKLWYCKNFHPFSKGVVHGVVNIILI